MIKNSFDIVRAFEKKLSEYTSAPYVITVDSCTNALLLCCKYLKVDIVTIPAKTYVSVPMSIIHTGGKVKFRDEDWKGIYQLAPYPIYDAARRFTQDMYIPKTYMCISFHGKKHLPIGRGGAILTDNEESLEWFKKARFDGRTEGIPVSEDSLNMIGYHCYMTPELAALGLRIMDFISNHNPDLIDIDPDLRKFEAFK